MFVYLRYFYAISLVLVIIGSFAISTMLRSVTAEELGVLIRDHDTALANQYISNIWQPFYPKDARLGGFNNMATFKAESQSFVKDLPKLRISVTDRQGKTVFESLANQLIGPDEKEIKVLVHQLSDQNATVSRIMGDVTLKRDGYPDQERAVVQTMIPIKNPSYFPDSAVCQNQTTNLRPTVCQPSLGMVEIVSDISNQWAEIDNMQLLIISSIIGIFLALITILFVTTQRAESIIAKQHEVNLELTAAAASAEAQSQDKSQFLANISHELRTPLNAIIGFSEIIKNDAINNLEPVHQEYIKDIHSSGKHLFSLINDILDFSKAEAGKLEIELSEIDISKLITNSMRLVIPRAEQAQVTLVEDLPKEHIIGKTDAKKLKQVLLNLLSNAVKFTPAGGEVRISAWEKVVDNKIIIQVKDTGIGIAPKDIAKVMTPFGQVDSALSRRYEGTGLGLPLSKKFVEILGGDFDVESEVNAGTTITITLPGQERSNSPSLQPQAGDQTQNT